MKNTFLKIVPVIIVVPILLFFLPKREHESYSAPSISVLTATFKTGVKPLPLYGINGNNSRGPSWLDKSFRDSVASLNFKIIRYPGGSLSSFWDWQKGEIVASDPKGYNSGIAVPETFRKSKLTRNSLNELRVLVKQTNCQVLFVLNMLTRPLSDQIEMLKTAQSLGIPVKYIELGNEYNLKKSPGRQKFTSAVVYGTVCNQWIIAIKQIFPNAMVAVVGGNKPYDISVRTWNNDVLNQVPNADAIVLHAYPIATRVIDQNGINFSRLLQTFKQTVNKQGFNSIRKDIWLTEYNINWAVNGPNQFKTNNQYAFTWSQALAILMMTSAATDLSNNSARIIIDHNVANASTFAAIETEKGTLRKLPNGIGLSIWCTACHDKQALRKIYFKQNVDGFADDAEIMGWQFSGSGLNTNLIINFSANTSDVNVSALKENGGEYKLMYAGKNDVINTWKDVKRETKPLKDNTIELPPYSVATF